MIREQLHRLQISEAVKSVTRFALMQAVEACEYLAGDANKFDYEKAISRLKGPVVEVGGPTYNYSVIHNSVPSTPIVTNYDECTDGIHAVVDARHLPFQNGSIGMVLISNLPREVTGCDYQGSLRHFAKRANEEYLTYLTDRGKIPTDERANLRISAIEEAARVLETKGLLVWQGGFEEDFSIAQSNGLSLVMVQTEDTGYTTYDCVFQK